MARKRLTDYPAALRARVADGYERGESVRAIAAALGVSTHLVKHVADLLAEAGALPTHPRRTRDQAKTAPATEARLARRDAGRADLSDLLLHRLGPTAAARILSRLEEEVELEAKVLAARAALDEAVLALEVVNAPDDAGDTDSPELAKVKKELRRAARERVADTRLVLTAYASARVPVRTLVGVLSRAVIDHLNLEGQAEALPPTVIVEFGAGLPAETPPRVYTEDELRAGELERR